MFLDSITFLTQGIFDALRETPKYMKVCLQHRAWVLRKHTDTYGYLKILADQFNQNQSTSAFCFVSQYFIFSAKTGKSTHIIFY